MKYSEALAQTIRWLRKDGRVSYAALKREFEMDDAFVEDVKVELIDAKRLARDENGKVLVWGPASTETPASAERGERRQLTVMFCDLVGSTALSHQLDPEDLREVLHAYQSTCVEVIERYEGHVAQYLGDGLLVYFGHPVAHEDDAQRAAQAGLQMIEALAARSAHNAPSIHARIGIHTGLVVIGEMGAGGRRELLALGETPNIAARVQGLAAADTVVVSASTQRLIAGLFDSEPLGVHELRGIATPTPLHRIVGQSGARTRFEAATRAPLTPLFGRARELDILRGLLARAMSGEGQAVFIEGEAGIGKSRLVRAVQDDALRAGATCLEFGCSPYHRNSALHPVIDALQRWLHFTQVDSDDDKLSKLEQALRARDLHAPDSMALLAQLLSLPAPFEPLTALSSHLQREKTNDLLLAWIERAARDTGASVVWQDLHWADPSTIELVHRFLKRLPRSRILTLATFRPDFPALSGAPSHVCRLALQRLGQDDIEAIVGALSGGKALPAEVVRQIVAKTDGVPLFVEELTKMVMDSGMLVEQRDGYALAGPLSPLSIPDTLQDSLAARLDRLAPVREVAQIAATLGREFSSSLIGAVSPLGEEALSDSLQQLEKAEILQRRERDGEVTYSFRHALIQDSAYQSQLRSVRRQRHQHIAQVLEQRFAALCATQPETVAHHYTEAGLVREGVTYWQRAGGQSLARGANQEAVAQLKRGLVLLATHPDAVERAQQELPMQTLLGAALLEIRGFAAPEVGAAFLRAEGLCGEFGNGPTLFPVLRGLYGFHLVTGEMEPAQRLADQLMALAAADPSSSSQRVEAHHTLGVIACHRGEFARATEELDHALGLYDRAAHGSHSAIYGMDPAVSSMIYSSWLLCYAGFPDQGLQRSRDSFELARAVGFPFNIANALVGLGLSHLQRGEPGEVRTHADACIALSLEQGFPHWLAWGQILRGWSIARTDAPDEGIAEIGRGLALHQAIGTKVSRPTTLGILADASLIAGSLNEGLAAVDEGLREVRERGEAWWHATLLDTRGRLLAARDAQRCSEAEACYREGIRVARRQGARYLEVGPATGLARILQASEGGPNARAALEQLRGSLSEGFETALLRDADSLLREVDQGD